MKKIVVIIICLLVLSGCNSNKFWDVTEDSKKFKAEYEALNGAANTSGTEYLELKIDLSNPIKYLDYEGMLRFLDNGNGLLYFGRPGCPYCRSTLDAMFEFAKDNEIKTIFYYDPELIRNENGADYQALLDKLDDYLPIDTVTQNEEDENFNHDLKRLVVPNLFFINNGKVIGNYNETRAEFRSSINDEQKDEIKGIYQELYDKYKNSLNQCTLEC